MSEPRTAGSDRQPDVGLSHIALVVADLDASIGFYGRFGGTLAGSVSTAPTTCVLDAPDLPGGLAARGYRTVCIGGVGFFNPATPLGGVLPGLFQESHWAPELGVTEPRSTEHQVALACRVLREARGWEKCSDHAPVTTDLG